MQDFLAQKRVDYTERDITADPAARDELEALGFFTTPVTLIDGVPVVGFDQKKLEDLLPT